MSAAPGTTSTRGSGFDDSAREEVRSRIDLVELIGRHVALKRRGGKFLGLCPFHQEKTPSFNVDSEKGYWHCFGCGAGGDVFAFVMRTENVDFAEALRKLAERAGVSLKSSPREKAVRAERDVVADLNTKAAKFYQQALESDDGAAARKFLDERGVSAESIKLFGLGYAPAGGVALVRHLLRDNASQGDIVKAGLATQAGPAGPGGEGLLDRFRGRLIFPIHDTEQRVVGFGARILPETEAQGGDRMAGAKYLNSSETLLFKKGRTLYGLPFAREAMAKAGRAVVVEGYLDVIACHQAGITETVATLGTALTIDHVQVLRRFVNTVHAGFDPDSAGLAALMRSLPMFREQEIQVKVIMLPAGADPDEVLRAHGAERLRELVDKAVSPVEFQLRQAAARLGGFSKTAPEVLMREVVPILAALPDEMEIGYWVRWLAQAWTRAGMRADRTEEDLRKEVQRQRERGVKTAPARTAPRPGTSRPPAASESPAAGSRLSAEEFLLAAMVAEPELAAAVPGVRALSPDDFADVTQREVFRALLERLEGTSDKSHGSEQTSDAMELLHSRLATLEVPPVTEAALGQAAQEVALHARRRRADALRERMQRKEELTDEELAEMHRLRREESAQAAKPITGQ